MNRLEISYTDVTDALADAVLERFPTLPIFVEAQDPMAEGPYMLLQLRSASQQQLMGRRYLRKQAYRIQYDRGTAEAEPGEVLAQLEAVAEELHESLAYLPIQSTVLRGSAMAHRIEEGKLHFDVQYHFHVLRPVPEVAAMQTMEQEGIVK